MSKELDIETLTRPGGIIPVNVETTAALVQHILHLRETLEWLNRRGGLGYEAHDRIRAALTPPDRVEDSK